MLALDIGGANLKLADGQGTVAARPFALWKAPQQLAAELRTFVASAGRASQPVKERDADGLGSPSYGNSIAVTMTGELVDCFANKTEGVRHILRAVDEALPNAERWIYLVDGRFVRPEEAAAVPLLAAASNWRALASFAARYVQHGKGLLIDVGSTTCDIIPLLNGKPAAHGTTDTTRIVAGELLYTGVERSSCSMIREWLTYRGRRCPMAQEFFATMKDVYVVLGQLAEDASDTDTADSRSSINANAIRRLGKLVCADELEFNADDATAFARELAEHQTDRLASAIRQVIDGAALSGSVARIILSGHGEFLARSALRKLQMELAFDSLTQELGPVVSRCATAHALAVLAREAKL